MDEILLQKLKKWRSGAANLEGIESFRVFANKVLEQISELKPSNKEELMSIKGIRDKKFAKYGKQILDLINDNKGLNSDESIGDQLNKPLSVSAYLDFLNRQLSKCHARIRGEISSVDIRERVIYFSLKDSDDGSVINCLMWKRNYDLSGIEFEAGMDVVLEGIPDIFKPYGKLSFNASSAELVGEGALKKAYDKLKKKLDSEGLFLKERKKEIPELSQKIGLITSEMGAVIHDFLTNLGKYGFQIKFVDSRVEGQAAVGDLVSAISYFSDKDIDVLVIIRGGGGLESLQAFNNEVLIRKIAGFSKPVICGIGHEKDVPLASLAADKMVSTPTAVANILNKPWQDAVSKMILTEEKIFSTFKSALYSSRESIEYHFKNIEENFGSIFKRFNQAEDLLKQSLVSLGSRLTELKRSISEYPNMILNTMTFAISRSKNKISSLERLVLTYNPERQLNLGYSIVRSGGAIIKSISQIKVDQEIDIMVKDGSFDSKVKKINKK